MKTIRELSKDREAVSPVIAVILMVAITVVLAAVLYVMVGGLISGPGSTTPTGQITGDYLTSTTHKIEFTTFSPETSWDEVRIRLTNDTTGSSDTVTWTLAFSGGSVTSTAFAGSATFGGQTVTLTIDEVLGSNQISQGDSATISNLYSGSTYTVTVIHIESGGVVDDVEFTK